MNTSRDAEIVAWLGRLGAAGAEHVMGRFGMGRSAAYQRLQVLARDGLLELQQVLHGRPGLYTATLEGLRWQGLERLGVYRVRPGGFEHAWEVARVAVALERRATREVVSERVIRLREREQRELIASVPVGRLPGGMPALHRPDLALLDEAGGAVAFEVELSVKAPARLAAICRAYSRARHIRQVIYLAAPAAARALGRAVAETSSEDVIAIFDLDMVESVGLEAGVGVSVDA